MRDDFDNQFMLLHNIPLEEMFYTITMYRWSNVSMKNLILRIENDSKFAPKNIDMNQLKDAIQKGAKTKYKKVPKYLMQQRDYLFYYKEFFEACENKGVDVLIVDKEDWLRAFPTKKKGIHKIKLT